MNLKLCILGVACALAVTACDNQKSDSRNEEKQTEAKSVEVSSSKPAVVYFSQTGATKKVAEEFAKQVGVTTTELKMVKAYPSSYDSTIAAVGQERKTKEWPALENAKMDLSAVDTLYLGYPIMFGSFAPPIYTFLDSNDLSGKVVVPFCTYGSGGRKASASEIKALEPSANVLLSFGISNRRVNDDEVKLSEEVSSFIANIRDGRNEEALLGGFSDMRPLASGDSAVFAEATKNYGYLHMEPLSVATQIVAGMNYLFAVSMKGPDGVPAQAQMRVFKPLPGRGKIQMIGVER